MSVISGGGKIRSELKLFRPENSQRNLPTDVTSWGFPQESLSEIPGPNGGNCHVRFLGRKKAVIPPTYSISRSKP